jgi:hypothetical protein
MAITAPFMTNKQAVLADMLAGAEVYVDIHGTCARKPNGGLLYRARAEVKSAKGGKVELVVPPLLALEAFVINSFRVTTKRSPFGIGNSVAVGTQINSLTVTVGNMLHIQPIEITLT